MERLNFAVAQSIVLHKYLGEYLPTKRGKGLDWTLGEDAVRLGQKTGYDYALFMHAELVRIAYAITGDLDGARARADVAHQPGRPARRCRRLRR